jgi:hypothetical protein
MFHFTMFGGADVKMDGTPKVIITIFGGTDVHRQTLAKRIMREKHLSAAERANAPHPNPNPFAYRPQRRQRNGCFMLTLFGGVDLKPPSIAEEFMDMREVIASGMVSSAEWDELVARIYELGDQEGHASLTMFGAMEESALSEQDEVKKIKSARDLGIISDDEELALRGVVGRDPQQIRMLLRQTAFA